MIKQQNEHHDMQWSEEAVSYDDLQGAYQNLLNGNSSEDAFDGLLDDNDKRRFLLYKWSNENVLTEYFQTGYATDMDTMIESGEEYEYSGNHLKSNLEG